MSYDLAGLGRLVERDDRNAEYKLPRMSVRVRRRIWPCPEPLDQGGTPMCVGYSGYQWLRAGPVENTEMSFSPKDLYRWAQQNDEWPGENYEGSSALGLMKALKQRGFVTEYRWAFDANTVMNWLLTSGPLLFGTAWYRDMFTPGKDNFVVVGGEDTGGHEYLLLGADLDKRCPDHSIGAVLMINSWGSGWGNKGRAWISKRDVAKLLANNGDCVTATEVDLDPLKSYAVAIP